MTNNNNVLAAIDIGTNSFHLIVVRVLSNGSFEIIDREKEVIRLGEGSTTDIKHITPAAIDRAIATLKNFKGIADSYNAEIRAVATSAVRESMNKQEFTDRVQRETGIVVEVVSGIEEARLIYLGIIKAVPCYDDKVLCVDIGGGSTEFIVGEKGKILSSISFKIGAVRLTNRFFPDAKITKQGIEDCRNWAAGVINTAVRKLGTYNYKYCIGSSGTIQSIALMAQTRRKGEVPEDKLLNNFRFTADELKAVEKEILSAKTVSDRKKIAGLESKRADIIPAGIIILSQIFKDFNLDDMVVSEYAMREGIVIDTIQKAETLEAEPSLTDIRMESVRNLANNSKYDQEHCEHVTKLALQIYDQLNDLHQLESDCREYLEAASLLHDIGYHIAHSRHHRHSMYMIRNSELLGFNENEIHIIANVARYHRKSHPKNRHEDFAALPDKSKEIVRKLSAILRIADSLDRTHQRKINRIDVKVLNGVVNISPVSDNGMPDIEMWNFDRRKALFEEVFDKKIEIV